MSIDWSEVDAKITKQRNAELYRVIENLRGEYGAIKSARDWADFAEIIADICKGFIDHPDDNWQAAQEVANLARSLDNVVEGLRWTAGALRVSAAVLGDDGIRAAINDERRRRVAALENQLEKVYAAARSKGVSI